MFFNCWDWFGSFGSSLLKFRVQLFHILCLIIALLFRLLNKQLFLQISSISNNGLFLTGAFLFLMQIHGYSHTIGPDEFGFPEDSHLHAHEEMESQSPMLGSEYRTLTYTESLQSKEFI